MIYDMSIINTAKLMTVIVLMQHRDHNALHASVLHHGEGTAGVFVKLVQSFVSRTSRLHFQSRLVGRLIEMSI